MVLGFLLVWIWSGASTERKIQNAVNV